MKKRLLSNLRIATALFLSVFSSNLLPVAVAYASDQPKPVYDVPTDGKLTICHSHQPNASNGNGLGPQDNPYNQETVSMDAVDGDGNSDHTGHTGVTTGQTTHVFHPGDLSWGDIIPAYAEYSETHGNNTTTYPAYAGLNWTAEGKAIYYSGCTVTTPTEMDATGEVSVSGPTCESNSVAEVANLANATLSGELDQSVGAHTATFLAVSGHQFSNGATTWEVPYTIEAQLTGEQCEEALTPATPGIVEATDVCGVQNDTFTIPTTEGVDYTIDGTVILAGEHPADGTVTIIAVAQPTYTLTDGYTFTKTFSNKPCVAPCEVPSNGGVITQNTPGWALSDQGAEFVNDGVAFSSNDWSDSYIYSTESYPISEAMNLGWTTESPIPSGTGTAIIFTTSSGANIHYEPSPVYTDDFWTNTPGVLPANGGGQGGPYSGTLQDLLDTAGDLTVVKTYFYFGSPTQNNIVLTSLSFNCATYTFDEHVQCGCDGEEETKNPVVDIDKSQPCIPYGQITGAFTVKVTNPNDASLTYRVEVNGDANDDAQSAVIPGGGNHTFTFSGYAAGTHTVEVFKGTSSLTAPLNIEDPSVEPLVTKTVKLDNCPPPTDVCPTVQGIQTDDRLCPPTPPVDVCPNVPGNQTDRDECGQTQGDTDVCPNITGSQTTVPVGKVKDSQGNCVTDICPNLTGIQTTLPAGFTQVNGDCVQPVGGQGQGQVLGTTLPATIPATGGTTMPNPLVSLVAAFLTYVFLYRRNRRAEV
jgi:hypothetical protein